MTGPLAGCLSVFTCSFPSRSADFTALQVSGIKMTRRELANAHLPHATYAPSKLGVPNHNKRHTRIRMHTIESGNNRTQNNARSGPRNGRIVRSARD